MIHHHLFEGVQKISEITAFEIFFTIKFIFTDLDHRGGRQRDNPGKSGSFHGAMENILDQDHC